MSEGAEVAIQILAEYMTQTYEVECAFCPKKYDAPFCLSGCTVEDATAARILWARDAIKRIRHAEGLEDNDESDDIIIRAL